VYLFLIIFIATCSFFFLSNQSAVVKNAHGVPAFVMDYSVLGLGRIFIICIWKLLISSSCDWSNKSDYCEIVLVFNGAAVTMFGMSLEGSLVTNDYPCSESFTVPMTRPRTFMHDNVV
jgi:hypothetical protein